MGSGLTDVQLDGDGDDGVGGEYALSRPIWTMTRQRLAYMHISQNVKRTFSHNDRKARPHLPDPCTLPFACLFWGRWQQIPARRSQRQRHQDFVGDVALRASVP